MNFGINAIISLYTIITASIAVICFITGKSECEKGSNTFWISNLNKIKRSYTGIYFLLLASVGCIVVTLRSLINKDWASIIGIVLIICFIIFTTCFKYEFIVSAYYDDKVEELKTKTTGDIKYSFYEYISQLYWKMLFKYMAIQRAIYVLEADKIPQVNSKISLYTYRFELINITISTICFLLNLIALCKYKIQFSLRSINALIITLPFILSGVYLMIKLKAKIRVILYFFNKRQPEDPGFKERNEEIFKHNRDLFFRSVFQNKQTLFDLSVL